MESWTVTAEHIDEFRRLEEALWISETRGDPQWMDEILSPTFTEHGKSGRTFDRVTIIEEEEIPPHIDIVLPLPDFAVRAVGQGAALVTYTAIVRGVPANRSSVWRFDGERWLLEFHQGTLALLPTTVDTARLREAEFSSRLRGYDTEAVKRFLSSIADRLDSGQRVASDEVATARFELTLRGSCSEEVDSFLAELHSQL